MSLTPDALRPGSTPDDADSTDNAKAIAAMEASMFTEQRTRRRRRTTTVWALRLLFLVVIVGTWSVASAKEWINPLFVSSPISIAKAFWVQLSDGRFWTDVLATFSGAMTGLAIGGIAGIVTGVVFSRAEILERATTPFLTLMNSLPRPALAPIFILWFGLGFAPKALVAASVVYFLMLTTTLGALRSIDHDIMQLTRSLNMTPIQRFFKIEMPSALPTITGALRLAAVYAVLGAVLSEMVGSYYGLGQRLVVLTSNFQVADSFAVLLFMGLMSMFLDFAISGIERLVKRRTS